MSWQLAIRDNSTYEEISHDYTREINAFFFLTIVTTLNYPY